MTLLLLTVGAWAVTISQGRTMDMGMGVVVPDTALEPAPDAMGDMGGAGEMNAMAPAEMEAMTDAGWSLRGLSTFVVAWAVMMAAMMLPAVAPMLLLYRTIATKKQTDGGAFVSTWVLVAGYLLVWTAVGFGVYALLRIVSQLAGQLPAAERQTWAPVALGAILVLAGLYQFTPLKHACLRQCQSPFGFVMSHWRDGTTGALRMGIIHGAYCLGCCWALFAVLVAAGVMSLAWMLLLTLVVFAEKVLPYGKHAAVAVGLTFIALGALVASGAARMPWIV